MYLVCIGRNQSIVPSFLALTDQVLVQLLGCCPPVVCPPVPPVFLRPLQRSCICRRLPIECDGHSICDHVIFVCTVIAKPSCCFPRRLGALEYLAPAQPAEGQTSTPTQHG